MPRTTDLIPVRLPSCLLLVVAGAVLLAALLGLHVWSLRMGQWSAHAAIASLNLAGRGTAAAWFSSMLLALAGILAAVVYSIRRHRRDDYRGNYRIWLWGALAWFFMSLDATAALRHDLAGLLAKASGTVLWGDGAIWWMLPYGFFFGGIGIRLLIDMRQSRLSTAALVLAALCYLGTAAARVFPLVEDPLRVLLIRYGALLGGHLFLVLAMALHARYVLLDAQGLLPQTDEDDTDEDDAVDEAADEDDDGEEEDEDEDEDEHQAGPSKPVRVHPPHGVPRPASPVIPPSSKLASTTAGAIPATSSPGLFGATAVSPSPVKRKLTKQEKKVLRERLARAREQREGQGK